MTEVEKGGVPHETAKADIERWLDYRRVRSKKRADMQDTIASLIDLVEDGVLVVDEDCHLIYELMDPIRDKETGNVVFSELTFKPRIRQYEVTQFLRNVKPNDVDGRISAYISALTGKAPGVVTKLITEDYSVAQNIALFFLG